jgi:hypothetical protein
LDVAASVTIQAGKTCKPQSDALGFRLIRRGRRPRLDPCSPSPRAEPINYNMQTSQKGMSKIGLTRCAEAFRSRLSLE